MKYIHENSYFQILDTCITRTSIFQMRTSSFTANELVNNFLVNFYAGIITSKMFYKG